MRHVGPSLGRDGFAQFDDSLPQGLLGYFRRAPWFGGSNWLVVYQSVDVGGTGYYQDSLEAVRVSATGIS